MKILIELEEGDMVARGEDFFLAMQSFSPPGAVYQISMSLDEYIPTSRVNAYYRGPFDSNFNEAYSWVRYTPPNKIPIRGD